MANSDPFIKTSYDTKREATQPRCPQCGSADTTSAAKRPTAASYWRCLGCGEVWSPAQLSSSGHRGWNR